jgi:sugar phosphate isomerase/epimerase
MRIGVAGGIVPRDLDQLDAARVDQLAALGISGVGTHFRGDPATLSRDLLRRAHDLFAARGIAIVQSWGWHQPLISDDEGVRREATRILAHAVRVAADLGAHAVMSGPGSFSKTGPWHPHPRNHSPEAEDALVRSLRETVGACEQYGVPIALEGHIVSTLDSATRIRRIIDRVGSPWIKISLDPVNYIAGFPALWDTTTLLNELFDTLGPSIVDAHIKDARARDGLVIHIDEAVPGEGVLDYATFFRRFEETLPGGYGLVEHLPDELYPRAVANVRRMLGEFGIASE